MGNAFHLETFMNFMCDKWLVLALPISLLWGMRSVYLFTPEPPNPATTNSYFYKKFSVTWIWTTSMAMYQFVFNFACSLVGFICIGELCSRYFQNSYDTVGLILLIIGVIGITGHLPELIHSITNNIKAFLGIVLDRLFKK